MNSALQEGNNTDVSFLSFFSAYVCRFPSGDLTSLSPLTLTWTTGVLDRSLNQPRGHRVPTRTLLTKAAREA